MPSMRKKDRKIPEHMALSIVDKCACFIMATVNPDGTPYCIPLSMARDGEWLYFHSALEGQKIDNLKHQNRVCIACTGETKAIPGEFSITYESALIFGTASAVSDREEKIKALRLISQRYTPANMTAFDEAVEKSLEYTGVWKIHIDEISGKAHS